MTKTMNEEHKIYEEMLEAELEQAATRILALRASAQNAAAREKLGYYDRLEDARIKENAVRQKLGSLKEANPGSWEEQKTAVDAAMGALEQTLSTAPVATR